MNSKSQITIRFYRRENETAMVRFLHGSPLEPVPVALRARYYPGLCRHLGLPLGKIEDVTDRGLPESWVKVGQRPLTEFTYHMDEIADPAP